MKQMSEARDQMGSAGHKPPRWEVDEIVQALRTALLARGLAPGGRVHGRRRNPKVKPRRFRAR